MELAWEFSVLSSKFMRILYSLCNIAVNVFSRGHQVQDQLKDSDETGLNQIVGVFFYCGKIHIS